MQRAMLLAPPRKHAPTYFPSGYSSVSRVNHVPEISRGFLQALLFFLLHPMLAPDTAPSSGNWVKVLNTWKGSKLISGAPQVLPTHCMAVSTVLQLYHSSYGQIHTLSMKLDASKAFSAKVYAA